MSAWSACMSTSQRLSTLDSPCVDHSASFTIPPRDVHPSYPIYTIHLPLVGDVLSRLADAEAGEDITDLHAAEHRPLALR